MNQLTSNHRNEWIASSVDESIIHLNVKSLSGNGILERLLYALPQTERRNDGRLRDRYLKQYAHAENGGWWVSGLDPLLDWQPMEWGRFKPDQPRQEWDKETQQLIEKIVKYESPVKTANRPTYLRVPLHIWQTVSRLYGVAMPDNIVITSEGEALGFWAWVQAHPQIPVVLTEGEKKAGCLLSLGFVAIGLPGIWGGRVGKGELEQMHPDLVPVAQKGRQFTILFDYETKPKTKLDIYRATYRTGWAINRQGCYCKVAILPGQEKGIDDWVAVLKNAHKSVTTLLGDARTISEYQSWFRLTRERGIHKYKPDIRVNTHYLSDAILRLPDSGLVCLLSDMNTGKTKLMEYWRQQKPEETFLNNGHLVNLLKNLAARLKTKMYSDLNTGDLGYSKSLSITIDSLYKLASNLQTYGCVFIDEACQYLAHLLKSKTCRNHRASILEVLECLVYKAKLVVLADAHLDDLTIDFFRAMRPAGEKPFIIQNDWKSGGREVYWYEGANSSDLVSQIHAQVLLGKKVIVVSDSKRFIQKVERSLLMLEDARIGEEENTLEPEEDRKLRIWTIHSGNSGSEENSIFISEINDAVTTVDVLLASPSIGTGVDISTPHFDVIFGAFHGVSQPATGCVQQLGRNRSNIPMHVWTAERPPFGYMETNPRRIKERYLQKNEMTAFLIRIDRETGKRGAEKDWALEASCQLEAQRNWSINNLRQDLRSLLESMGNTIIPMGDQVSKSANNLMESAAKIIDREHCEAVASAKEIDSKIHKARQRLDYLKPEEYLECEKYRIKDAYGVEVTPELVAKDDGGRLLRKLLCLEEILAPPGEIIVDEQGREVITPPQLVVEKDRDERENLAICTDWRNHSASWLMRHELGLREIILTMQGQEISNTNEQLQALAKRAHLYRSHIKQILNLSIPSDASPTWILGSLINQLGLATSSRRLGDKDNRVRFYTLSTSELEFAQQVLTYRQQRRDEKERKRKLDQEIADGRVTGIASQYGFSANSPPTSTPPPFISGEYFKGGLDTNENQQEKEDLVTTQWWEKVKIYTLLVVEKLSDGVTAVKEVLSSLSRDEKWGVLTGFDEFDPEYFERFTSLIPDYIEFFNS